MKYKLLLIFILSVSTFVAKAQIANEIKSYVDSTEIIVNNGRKLLLDNLSEDNLLKTKDIYLYLKEATESKSYAAFYYVEEIYLNTIFKDWESLLVLAQNYDALKNTVVPQNAVAIYSVLFEKVKTDIDEYTENLEFQHLQALDKVVIEMFLKIVKTQKTDQEYNALFKEYKRLAQNDKKYQLFVDAFLPAKFVRASLAWSFGSGMFFPQNNLGLEFDTKPLYMLSMDTNIDKVYTSLYVLGGQFVLNNGFDALLNNSHITFLQGDEFQYIEGGIKVGYFVHRGDRFQLAPYTTLSGASLESTLYTEDSPNEELYIINSISLEAGLHSELKLYEFNATSYYGTEESSYLSLKLDCSYKTFPSIYSDDYKGALPYVSLSLSWGFGIF